MKNKDLKESLDALQSELSKLQSADAELKDKITGIVERLEQQLDYPEDVEDGDSVTEHLRHVIEQFEAEHPSTTGILNRIMVTLANMGI